MKLVCFVQDIKSFLKTSLCWNLSGDTFSFPMKQPLKGFLMPTFIVVDKFLLIIFVSVCTSNIFFHQDNWSRLMFLIIMVIKSQMIRLCKGSRAFNDVG